MKKTIALLLVALAFFAIGRFSAVSETVPAPYPAGQPGSSESPPAVSSNTPQADDGQGRAALADAYTRRLQDVRIEASGRVLKVLPDDNQGSRHQRFLLDTGLGHSLLIAHNIDLAPRIPDLQHGDLVHFKGEYVWNEKGGVVHWTHHDPDGSHPGGWLKHNGLTYE
jgi:Protein of unknown function (DUF3465)